MKVAAVNQRVFDQPLQGMALYLKLVLTGIFWGGTFVAGRIIAGQIGPFSAAFLRFAIASFFLLLFTLKFNGRLPRLERDQYIPLLLLGLTGIFAYNVFFFSGLRTISASRASLIISSNPAFIALLSSLFFRERLNFLKILGIVLSVSGAVTVISHGNLLEVMREGLGTGELFIFGCVASWVAYSLIGKTAMKRLSPLVTVTYACFIGALLLAVPAYVEGVVKDMTRHSPVVWLSIFYLGFFGSALGFFWYYEGIKEIGPSRAGVFINIVPISAIVLASLILKEPVDASLAAGAVLVVTGVFLTNKTPSSRKS